MITTLSNGLRVISFTGSQFKVGNQGNLGVFFQGGSRNGEAHLMSKLFLARNGQGSGFATGRRLLDLNSNLAPFFSRELSGVTATVTDKTINSIIDTLGFTLFRPSFINHEVEAAKKVALEEQLANQPDSIQIVDLLHKAAFNDTLGNSLYTSLESSKSSNPQSLIDTHANNHTLDRTIVVSTGDITHDQVVAACERHFVDNPLPNASIKQIFETAGANALEYLNSEEGQTDLSQILQPAEMDRLNRMLKTDADRTLDEFKSGDLYNFLQAYNSKGIDAARKNAQADFRPAPVKASKFKGNSVHSPATSSSTATVGVGFNVPIENVPAGQVLAKLLKNEGVDAELYDYSDSALLGLYSTASTSTGDFKDQTPPSATAADNLVKALAKVAKASASDVSAAKESAIVGASRLYSGDLGPESFTSAVAQKVLYSKAAPDTLLNSIVDPLTKVKPDDVTKLAKSLATSTPAIASCGNNASVSKF